MFRVFDFSRLGGLKRETHLPTHLARIAERLAGGFDADEEELTNETVAAWAAFAESLIPLRLPHYFVWEHPALGGDDRLVLCSHRAGAAYAAANLDPFRRPANIEDVDVAHVVWHALQGSEDSSLFVSDPPPLPTTPRNCAIAYALLRLDRAVADDLSGSKMCEEMSLIALLLAAVTEDWGRGDGRIAATEAAASARWERDPSRAMWKDVRQEWDRWQSNRALYRYPRDFRRAMQLKHPELVDGTLKNRMSSWGRGEP